MKKYLVNQKESGQTLEKYVKKVLSNAPLSFIYKLFRKKDIRVNGHWQKEKYVINENDEVTIIKSGVFANDYNLVNISFPNCITIEEVAFFGAEELKNADFLNCASIKDQAFQYCSSLSSINFPNCSYIGNYAFYDCINLISINLLNCSYIATYAFYNCTNLTTINIPNCSYIGSSAFYSCINLTTIDIPNCSYIGSYAFKYCSRLSSIYLLTFTRPSLQNSNVFSYTPLTDSSYLSDKYGSIYVRQSLLTSFKTGLYWSYFSSRFVGLTDEEITNLNFN